MNNTLFLVLILLALSCGKTDPELILESTIVLSEANLNVFEAYRLNVDEAKLTTDESIVIVGNGAEIEDRLLTNPFLAVLNQNSQDLSVNFLEYDDENIFRPLRLVLDDSDNPIITSQASDNGRTSGQLVDRDSDDIDLRKVNKATFFTEWLSTFGDIGNDEEGEALTILPNGDILLLSSFQNEIPYYDFYILSRIDPNGNLIWEKKIEDELIKDLDDILYLEEDDSFVVISKHFDANRDKIKITKFTIDGDIEMSVPILENGSVILPSGLINLIDGNILAYYSSFSRILDRPETTLIKLDSNFSIIWRQQFSDIDDDHTSDVIQTVDGSFLILSTNITLTTGSSIMTISKADSQGNILWRKSYGDGGIGAITPSNVFEKNNGNILIIGSISINFLFTLEMDSEGVPL